MHFVFWHPCLSIHHAPLMRRLSMMSDVSVTLVARLALENGRESSGWSIPDYGHTRLIETSNCDWRVLVPEVINGAGQETLHLTSDPMFNPISRCAWRLCAKQGIPFGFISICPGMYVGRFGRWLRKFLYRLYVRRAARNVNPILAISRECRQFFVDNGFNGDCVYPWAYFVEDQARLRETTPSKELRLIYLGRLLKRKRVDVLLGAMSRVVREHHHLRLTIIGSGPEDQSLRDTANELQLSDHVEFRPTIPHQDVHGELQKHDVLVLPTECDDWGVVVNEALQAGLAVITSENAGASELIQCGRTGLVCKCNVDAFAAAIARLASSPQLLSEMRNRSRDYSRTISPDAAAHYLRAVADHVLHQTARPCAPWQKQMNCGESA